jgi:hypothetical protein
MYLLILFINNNLVINCNYHLFYNDIQTSFILIIEFYNKYRFGFFRYSYYFISNSFFYQKSYLVQYLTNKIKRRTKAATLRIRFVWILGEINAKRISTDNIPIIK